MSTPAEESGNIPLQRIIINRLLRADGQEVYNCEFLDFSDIESPEGMPWMDGLALLEAAKFDLYERIVRGEMPREQP